VPPCQPPSRTKAFRESATALLNRLAFRVAIERRVGAGQRSLRERAGDILLHLFEHQIHHRGQVHAMLAGTRVAPPQLDEFFLREELPLRRRDLEALGLPLE
jgi:uncharacterized damage-inducible protein DinB